MRVPEIKILALALLEPVAHSGTQSVCIRSVSEVVCESLVDAAPGASNTLVPNVVRSMRATSCEAQDCVLDVAYPSNSAHCQGVTLTPVRSNAPESSTEDAESSVFLNSF